MLISVLREKQFAKTHHEGVFWNVLPLSRSSDYTYIMSGIFPCAKSGSKYAYC